MPIYEYKCRDCHFDFEREQHMQDDPIQVCPACGGKVSRVIQPINIIYRGRGFYKTDNKPQELENLD